MTKILSSAFCFFALVIWAPAFAQTQANSQPPQTKPTQTKKLSSVELQWEDIPGAFMFEVEVYNSKGKKLKSFVSKTSLFKFNSTSGKIKLRGRVLDAYGKKGLWSSTIEVEVPPEDLKFSDLPSNQIPIVAQANSKTSKGKVNLSWPESIQAKRYLVKIYDQNKKLITEKETANLNEKFDLDVGIYNYSVTPIGIDRILGKEVPAPNSIQIGSAQLIKPNFEVTESEKSLTIKMPTRNGFEIFGALEYANHLSETWTPVLDYTPFADDIWTPQDKLKPGRYRIGFWIAKKGWVNSEKFHHQFVIKPTEEEIKAN